MDERAPLVDKASPSLPPLGTARFPFHPRAATTPLWRKLLLLVFDGHRRLSALDERNVWPLEPSLSGAQAAGDLQKRMPLRGRARLLRAAWAANRRCLGTSIALRVVAFGLAAARPLLLRHVATGSHRGMGLLVGVAVLYGATAFIECHRYPVDNQVELQINNGLKAMVMDNIVREGLSTTLDATTSTDGISTTSTHKQRLPQTTKMLVDDLEAASTSLIAALNAVSAACLLLVVATVLVYLVDMSWTVMAAIAGFYAVVFALEFVIAQPLAERAEAAFVHRLNTVHESLKGIQMVKLSAWEDKVEAKILHARARERVAADRSFALGVVIQQLIIDSPMLFAAIAFGARALSSDVVDTEQSFPPMRVLASLLLLSDCLQSAKGLKHAFETAAMGTGAWQRIEALLCGDSDAKTTQRKPVEATPASVADSLSDVVQMSGVCLSSPQASSCTPTLLINVEWHVRQGHLVVVHGAAGAGKSMLLAAIRQDLAAVQVLQGSLKPIPSNCRVAYCSQDPWLQELSIRDNILFCTPFEAKKYWAVVEACGLLEDLSVLPAGDATTVGPRGINLSSGQSARIALARACYADADLYLLDCPLANVDAVVQSEIFRRCIVELLMFKTVVIVTHNPEYIGSSFVDQLVHVQSLSVRVTNRASRRKLNNRNEHLVSRRLRDYQHKFKGRDSTDRSLCIVSLSRDSQLLVDRIESCWTQRKSMKHGEDLVDRIVSTTTSVRYLFNAHRGYALLSIALAALWGVACVMRDVWMMKWASLGSHSAARERIGSQFAYLVIVSFVIALVARGCIAILKSQLASQLFKAMTHAVLHSSMTLFYHTPVGETLNRYFTDVITVDEMLPRQLALFVLSIVSLGCRAVVIGWILGPVGVLVLVAGYALMTRTLSVRFCVNSILLYLRKRIEMLSLLSGIVEGEAVIRAFGTQRALHMFRTLDRANDFVARHAYFMNAFNSSVILHGELQVTVLALALLGLVAAQDLTPAKHGLVLLYIFSLQQDAIRTFSTGMGNTALSFSCVDRLREYGNMPTESDADSSGIVLVNERSSKWLEVGSVTFDHVDFSYVSPGPDAIDAALALCDVSFSLRGGEKVGVIGRTGSGKSSLAMALLRVHPLHSGRILLDGVDLRSVSLTQLRRSFTVIPQSPTFCRCSIRDYLDPFHEFDDALLWKELLTVELGSRVQSLEEELLDNGENWSLGQRQLLCFARALLKPSRVVILDEAFSCVDQTCQEKVLRIVQERFFCVVDGGVDHASFGSDFDI